MAMSRRCAPKSRTNLKREVSKRLQAKVKDQVMEALLKTNPIDVPECAPRNGNPASDAIRVRTWNSAAAPR